MTITSSVFNHNEYIPSKYTCEGENHNPPLTFSKVPENAQSLALIVEDPDAPSKTFTHWLIYNIPPASNAASPATLQIHENQVPRASMQGMTDFGKVGYGGPCPPVGTHRYFFKLFALDSMLDVPQEATKQEVEEAMKGHVLDFAELIGLYEKKDEKVFTRQNGAEESLSPQDAL